MPKRRAVRLGILAGCTAVAAAAIWVLAIVILPEDGWLRPGQVTAFGLLVMVGLVVTFLAVEDRESKKAERERLVRRRRRREHEGSRSPGS